MPFPSVAAIERAGLIAWPGIEVEWDGEWVRRAANGYTKRANSLQCLDPSDDDDAAARLQQGRRWFEARGLPAVVRTTPLESPGLTAALDADGWTSIDRSHVLAMPLPEPVPNPGSLILSVDDERFLEAQRRLQAYSAQQMAGLQALLGAFAVPAAGIVVYRDSQPAASGLMAIADGIVVTGNVVTDPTRRREGLASAMMRTGFAWARATGASWAALNVQANNDGARALYQSLGFSHQYGYRYRIPGAPA